MQVWRPGLELANPSLSSRTAANAVHCCRFSWWAMAYEFVVLAGLCGALISNTAHRTMNSWVGLFSIASILFIYGSGENTCIR
jgi:hypothetical protein